MKATYKKILKAIMSGKTVVLDVGAKTMFSNPRLRVLTKKDCFFALYDNDAQCMFRSCFSEYWVHFRVAHREGKDLIEAMEQFDKEECLKIKRIHIMK